MGVAGGIDHDRHLVAQGERKALRLDCAFEGDAIACLLPRRQHDILDAGLPHAGAFLLLALIRRQGGNRSLDIEQPRRLQAGDHIVTPLSPQGSGDGAVMLTSDVPLAEFEFQDARYFSRRA